MKNQPSGEDTGLDQAYRRFLIVRTDRIGDVILTLPMARVLKKCRPGAHVAMLVQSYTSELVSADPNVDQVISVDSHCPPYARTVAELRRANFDVVFHTHPRPRLALITALAGIPVRVGTGYRWYSFLFNRRVYEHRKDALKHELEYNLNLLRAVGCDAPWGDVRPRIDVEEAHMVKARRALADAGVPPGAKLAILHPGSGASARDWSPDNFAALASILAAHDGLAVLLTGGKGEERLVAGIRALCPPEVRSIVGSLGIREYAALAKLASVFIANSTGPLHIAAAVGTPVIGLYPQIRPLSAPRWGPYTDRKTVFTPKGFPEDCSRCVGTRGSRCECMDSIPPGDVHDAAMRLLGAEAGVS
ncbi:MAG TPA: glycosyltransferase family 9 protein [Bacteroidota bacterium]|nr:glycosyltransferase family 9 protein [Bacteroidota bacterium]